NCMRSSATRAYSLLFLLSGATGLVYELLWVRLLYQAFGSTIQSVTTVVAAYMGGLGLGAWWLGRRADRHPNPAALYGRLQRALGRLYGLNTLGAVAGTALAGFVLIERVGIRLSLWGTAAVNLALGLAALALAAPPEPSPVPPSPLRVGGGGAVRRAALALLAVTAFASLLDEIAWTRVLVMVVGGSTYAFTLVLLVFLLGIGLGSAYVARGRAAGPATTADAALAQGITGAGAALLLAFFGALPLYVIRVFGHPAFGATERLALLGLAVGAVVLIPAVGMGLSFPLIADLAA